MKNFLGELFRELDVNETIIDEGLMKMEEIREVFLKRQAICEKFDKTTINAEIIEPLFDQLGSDEQLVYLIKADNDEIVRFVSQFFNSIVEKKDEKALIKKDLIEPKAYVLQFNAFNFYLFKKHFGNVLYGTGKLNPRELVKIISKMEMERPVALRQTPFPALLQKEKKVMANFENFFLEKCQENKLHKYYQKYSVHKKLSFNEHQKLMLNFLFTNKLQFSKYRAMDIYNLHNKLKISPEYFRIQNETYIKSIFEFEQIQKWENTFWRYDQLQFFEPAILGQQNLYESLGGSKIFKQLMQDINGRHLISKEIETIFAKENSDMALHNSKMMLSILDNESPFTLQDLREAHEKLDLRETDIQLYLNLIIESFKENQIDDGITKSFYAKFQQIAKLILIKK